MPLTSLVSHPSTHHPASLAGARGGTAGDRRLPGLPAVSQESLSRFMG